MTDMRGDPLEASMNRREPDGLAERLRREAACDRPRFSEFLHGRILQVLPPEPEGARRAATVGPRLVAALRPASLRYLLIATCAAAAAAMIVIVGARPRQAGDLPAGIGTAAATTDDSALGIERMPMFDDLQASVQEGVASLASSLLDVPEWQAVVDFDAASLLEREVGR